jgi:DNA replication protein DnaC
VTPDETTLRSEAIRQYCRQLRVPTVATQFGRLAEEAVRQQHGPVRYLEALLGAEIEERERNAILRRVFEAKLPRMKTLEEFDFAQSPQVSAGRIHQLAEGAWITRTEPILFIGEPGTGKTHLATGLCVSACRQRRRARFTTAAALVNELVEAKHTNQLSRAMGRWSRYEVIVLDEPGYVPLAEVGAELLFQVSPIALRRRRSSLRPTCHSLSGRRSFRTLACARPCWTASQTELTSSRLAPSRIGSAAPSRKGGSKEPQQAQRYRAAEISELLHEVGPNEVIKRGQVELTNAAWSTTPNSTRRSATPIHTGIRRW